MPIKKNLTAAKISKEKVRKIWTAAFTREIESANLPLKGFILMSFVINVFMAIIVLVLFYLKRIPSEVPVFYGAPEGEDQLVAGYFLVIPALVSSGVLVINTIISYFVADEFLKRILIFAGITITILSTITIIQILFLVGYF